MGLTPEMIKMFGEEFWKDGIDYLQKQGEFPDFFYTKVDIFNPHTGKMKTVGKDEWLGHYQSNKNWTIQKDYMEDMLNKIKNN